MPIISNISVGDLPPFSLPKFFYTNFRERVGSAWHAGSIYNVHTQINSGGSSRWRGGGLVISGEEIQALQTLVSSSTTVRGITI